MASRWRPDGRPPPWRPSSHTNSSRSGASRGCEAHLADPGPRSCAGHASIGPGSPFRMWSVPAPSPACKPCCPESSSRRTAAPDSRTRACVGPSPRQLRSNRRVAGRLCPEPIRLYGSTGLGSVMVWAIVVLALVGIVARTLTALRRDAPLLGYLGLSVVALACTPFTSRGSLPARPAHPLLRRAVDTRGHRCHRGRPPDDRSGAHRVGRRTRGCRSLHPDRSALAIGHRRAHRCRTPHPLLIETTGETRRYASVI